MQSCFLSTSDRLVVAGIDMAQDAHRWIVRQHALQLLIGVGAAVGDDYHARVQRIADPDTTAAYRSVLAASVPPSVVAEAVFEAVTAGRLFVLPSPELDPLVEARLEEVRGAMRR